MAKAYYDKVKPQGVVAFDVGSFANRPETKFFDHLTQTLKLGGKPQ